MGRYGVSLLERVAGKRKDCVWNKGKAFPSIVAKNTDRLTFRMRYYFKGDTLD